MLPDQGLCCGSVLLMLIKSDGHIKAKFRGWGLNIQYRQHFVCSSEKWGAAFSHSTGGLVGQYALVEPNYRHQHLHVHHPVPRRKPTQTPARCHVEPRTLLLWGNSANHFTTLPHTHKEKVATTIAFQDEYVQLQTCPSWWRLLGLIYPKFTSAKICAQVQLNAITDVYRTRYFLLSSRSVAEFNMY